MREIILASNSKIRRKLLDSAGIEYLAVPSHIDEETAKISLRDQNLSPAFQAHELAKLKAQKISRKYPNAFVIGCDQMLSFSGIAFDKAHDMAQAKDRLKQLREQTHFLCNALVIYHNLQLVFRFDCAPKLKMRAFSDEFIDYYLEKAGPEILDSVGCYQFEGLGSQLFEKIEGDYFAILGLPLLELLAYLREHRLVLT